MLSRIVLQILKGINRRLNTTNWKDLRNLHPISEMFSYDRGNQSIPRYYVDLFIRTNSEKINGNVLEVADKTYMNQYKSQISKMSVIHYTEATDEDAFVGDLTKPETLPGNKFDCFICTQTFNFIYDFRAAVHGSHHVLKDNGYLLATVSGIQQISQFDASRWGDYWRFTVQSCIRLFSEVYGEENVSVLSYGNVLSTIAAMEGLSSAELTVKELDYNDPNYELIIGIVARKRSTLKKEK